MFVYKARTSRNKKTIEEFWIQKIDFKQGLIPVFILTFFLKKIDVNRQDYESKSAIKNSLLLLIQFAVNMKL